MSGRPIVHASDEIHVKPKLEDADDLKELYENIVAYELKLEEEADDSLKQPSVADDLKSPSRCSYPIEVKSEDISLGTETSPTSYLSFTVKNYTSTTFRPEPISEMNTIFINNSFELETQRFHQQLLEDIITDSNHIKLKDLQAQYINRLREVADLEIFNCSLCPYKTINMTSLKCHLLIIHERKIEHKMFKCTQKKCNFGTDIKLSIKNHLIYHTKKKDVKFECSTCSYIGPSLRALKKHRLKHKEIFVKCDLCDFQSDNTNTIREHKSTHICPETNKYKCYKCEYMVGHKLQLAKHLFKVHQVVNKRIEQINLLSCNACDYKTDSKHHLKVHSSLQHKNPDEIEYFYCNLCAFKSKYAKSLRDHQTTHSKEKVKTKMCEICSYKCSKLSDLHRHLLTHKRITEVSENDVHQCPEPGCNYRTKSKCNLSGHLLTHKDPMFICETCGYRAKRKVNYQRHLFQHKEAAEIEIFKCYLCPYQTKVKRNLEKHMKMGDHTGRNLKHIPIRYRIETTDKNEISSN